MRNQYDIGMQQDFDNMTLELGREMYVYPPSYILDYEGRETTGSNPLTSGTKEIVFLQELNSQSEVIGSGAFKIGDVRLTFQHDTVAEEEGYIVTNGNTYKISELTYVGGQSNNETIYVKAMGVKVPGR